MRSSSPFIASAVRATTGMSRVASSLLSRAVASSPSMPGSWISISIRSGCPLRANVNPVSADVALSTEWPADCSRNVAKVMLAALSSMIRTFAMSGYHKATGHCSPDFGNKAVAVEVGLFHDCHHVAIELGAVFQCDVFRRNHDDGNGSGRGIFDECRDHIEAVDLGHHEIEHDQIRNFSPRGIDRLATTVCAQHSARQAQNSDGNEFHRLGVVIHNE